MPQNANLDRWTFTPNITDINEDGWLDVLLTGDFGKTVALYLHTNDGMPIVDQAVTLTVTQGPLSGQNQTLNTNVQGKVQFSLQSTQTGTDRLQFDFTTTDKQNHVCRALVNWQQDIIYTSSF